MIFHLPFWVLGGDSFNKKTDLQEKHKEKCYVHVACLHRRYLRKVTNDLK